jgi:hypothetical protein
VETDGETTNLLATGVGEVSHEADDAVHSEGGDIFESDVAGNDCDGVDDGVGVLAVVGGVGGEVAD